MCPVTVFEQDGFDLRVEWGLDGVHALGPHCAVLVIVDVLVFTTTVDVAVSQGARVLPLPWRDERAAEAAAAAGATLTPTGLTYQDDVPTASDTKGWTLRPSSLDGRVPAGTFLGITSANGAHLSAAAAGSGATVLAGCLRNASAVAARAVELAGDRPIGVIPAGERWRTDGLPLRPAIEDYLGAGAIVAAITGRVAPSPEATLASLAYRAAPVRALLADAISGRELAGAGVATDVALASVVDVSDTVPVLKAGVYQA
ncbi:2-phosphosulfolactate phosphatase [Actinophytocola oryzae]|uniref:Probable 2-phosphosulfolactate phosphatase n=1 Tax=Actinophytocola oryzae TaxID=502181 RepID=A0A4R7UT33_9PSEU|nr:2-phosphosulfolactate phosphatase [Actinophytocola oryzae]TDV38735.1 2-phosphosulfolactate phosphatase [Actinophytocola oryzae]